MKGKSKLNNAWIAVLLLALLVGLGPIPSLVPIEAASAGEASVLPGAQLNALKPALPATDLVPAEVSPVAVEDGWWATVQENIRRSQYHITWQEQTYLDDVPVAYQAPNRAQNLRTYFDSGGPILIPRVWAEETAVPPWRWEVRLVAWGRAGSLQPVAQGGLQVQENLVEYRRGDLVEWYR